jgi:hypothetical protein
MGAGVKGPGVAFVEDEEGVGVGAGFGGLLEVGSSHPRILSPLSAIIVPF